MNWTGIDKTAAQVLLPEGYRFELLQRAEIPGLIGAINAWFPDISVGSASCYLREGFCGEEVFFPMRRRRTSWSS